MMCGLCVPCGAADGWLDAAVGRQQHGEIGVCSGTAGRGRGDQSGDSGLHKLDGTTLRGTLCEGMRGSLRASMHAFVAGIQSALEWCALEGLGREVMEPMPCVMSWEASREWGASTRVDAVVRLGMTA
jgi:hypothetical protein